MRTFPFLAAPAATANAPTQQLNLPAELGARNAQEIERAEATTSVLIEEQLRWSGPAGVLLDRARARRAAPPKARRGRQKGDTVRA